MRSFPSRGRSGRPTPFFGSATDGGPGHLELAALRRKLDRIDPTYEPSRSGHGRLDERDHAIDGALKGLGTFLGAAGCAVTQRAGS